MTTERDISTAATIIHRLKTRAPVLWINADRQRNYCVPRNSRVTMKLVLDAEQRLMRFAPVLARIFPELGAAKGVVESRLLHIPRLSKEILASTLRTCSTLMLPLWPTPHAVTGFAPSSKTGR